MDACLQGAYKKSAPIAPGAIASRVNSAKVLMGGRISLGRILFRCSMRAQPPNVSVCLSSPVRHAKNPSRHVKITIS